MKISGFSLIRNGVKFDYPFLESYRSVLPLVDELVVNVGRSEDTTLQKLQELARENPKVRIIEIAWPELSSGLVLSEMTNVALDSCKNDLCLYLQSDEILHEEDFSKIKSAFEKMASDSTIDGLVFEYEHFYGSYDVVQKTRSSYQREIRGVRKSSGAKSVGDAQSFRKNGAKLSCISTDARIFHYGWVRSPETMREKTFAMDELYHGKTNGQAPHTGDNYKYKRYWGLKKFNGTHPAVMSERLRTKAWHWDLSKSPFVFGAGDIKKVILDSIENVTGVRLFENKGYIWHRGTPKGSPKVGK